MAIQDGHQLCLLYHHPMLSLVFGTARLIEAMICDSGPVQPSCLYQEPPQGRDFFPTRVEGSYFSHLSSSLHGSEVASVPLWEHLSGDASFPLFHPSPFSSPKQPPSKYLHIPGTVGNVDGWPQAVSSPTAGSGGVTGSGPTKARA